MQFFSYHIACREDSVASKESQAFKPTRSHNTERKYIINTARRRDITA